MPSASPGLTWMASREDPDSHTLATTLTETEALPGSVPSIGPVRAISVAFFLSPGTTAAKLAMPSTVVVVVVATLTAVSEPA